MVAVPELTPVTTPVADTVATPVAAELHAPPVTISVRFVAEPEQKENVPVIVPELASGLTVTTAVA